MKEVILYEHMEWSVPPGSSPARSFLSDVMFHHADTQIELGADLLSDAAAMEVSKQWLSPVLSAPLQEYF